MTGRLAVARIRDTARRYSVSAVPYGLLVPATCFLVFLLIATGFLVRYSFNAWDPSTSMVSAWTLQSYRQFFSQPYFFGALLSTMRIALTITVIALLMGYPIAYLMTRSPRHRNLLMMLVLVPLVMDAVIRAFGWIILLSNSGLVNTVILGLHLSKTPLRLLFTQSGVVIELLHETLAFMVLPIAAVLQKIDPRLGEASGTLGANKWQKFWLITLPLSLPGVLAGTLLVFALGMGAFVGPLILGGGNITMMALVISDQMGVTIDWPLGSAMSIILVAITLILLFFYGRSLRAGTAGHQARSGIRQ